MIDSQQLLAEYVKTGSEPAFHELVARYVGLVYSAAVRLVDGDTHLAEDITQMVFADLARMARSLSRETMLGGWLHRHTCFVAAKAMRRERRRQSRERQAVEMNALQDHSEANLKAVVPVLDEVINQLGTADRSAILLRFFEQQSFRSVGLTLHCHEDAARKRVTRALEKLHVLLKRRGVTFSTATLVSVLASETVHAVPAGLASVVSASSWAATAAGSGTSLTLLKIMTMTNLQTAMISAVAVVAAAAAPMAIQHQAQVKLREENQSLRQQIDRTVAMADDGQHPASGPTALADAPPTNEQVSELLKLRAEVTRLRNDSQELAQLKAAAKNSTVSEPALPTDRIALLKERLEQMPQFKIPELQFLTDRDWQMVTNMMTRRLDTDDDYRRAFSYLREAAKKEFMPKLGQAVHRYAQTNDGRLPADLTQLKSYFSVPVDDAVFPRYELKQSGKLSDVPQIGTYPPPSGNPELDAVRRDHKTALPWTEPIIVEKAAVDDLYDSLFTLTEYGFSYQSNTKGSIGSGSGTWAKVGPDGTPELLFDSRSGGVNRQMSTASSGQGETSGGGGGSGGFGFSSQTSHYTTNASGLSTP
jgi:RNA polymerase sigma factor (sigma-70 family)